MSRWKYDSPDAGQLVDGEFVIDLEPSQEFDAPDSFKPEPNPHPVFKPVSPKTPATPPKPAPAPAPQE